MIIINNQGGIWSPPHLCLHLTPLPRHSPLILRPFHPAPSVSETLPLDQLRPNVHET